MPHYRRIFLGKLASAGLVGTGSLLRSPLGDGLEPIELSFVTTRDPQWQAFLDQVPHDYYHRPEYFEMYARAEQGVAEAALAVGGEYYFFMPYIVRPLTQVAWIGHEGRRLFDLTSPYGYAGPLLSPSGFEFHCKAVRAWASAMREHRVISGFTRLHPLLTHHQDALSCAGSVLLRGQTVSIDLTLSPEALWQQTRPNHRNEISQARRLGVTAHIEPDYAAAIDIFLPMYHDTMRRAEATASYFFPRDYFFDLKRVLGDSLSVCIVRAPTGEPIGGGMFTECQGIVQYHLSATTEAGGPLRSTKIMIDFIRTWAQERGNRVLHLGGGVGAKQDSLFEFKARFSPLRHDFYTWQTVFLPETYLDLETRRKAITPPPQGDFFPIYRG